MEENVTEFNKIIEANFELIEKLEKDMKKIVQVPTRSLFGAPPAGYKPPESSGLTIGTSHYLVNDHPNLNHFTD